MFKNGWMRVWVVLTAILLTGVIAISAYNVWGIDACYSFVSISIANDIQPEDRQLAENLKREATTKTFCGETQYSVILTLEALAQRGVVTQIGFQWLEPSGWSFNKHDMFELLNGHKIRAHGIISHASADVHHARLLNIRWLIVAAFSGSFLVLAVGFGIAWIRKGFAK